MGKKTKTKKKKRVFGVRQLPTYEIGSTSEGTYVLVTTGCPTHITLAALPGRFPSGLPADRHAQGKQLLREVLGFHPRGLSARAPFNIQPCLSTVNL